MLTANELYSLRQKFDIASLSSNIRLVKEGIKACEDIAIQSIKEGSYFVAHLYLERALELQVKLCPTLPHKNLCKKDGE